MDEAEFIRRIRAAATPGKTFPNPGGGTSTILRHSDSAIYYRRGVSESLYLKFDEMYRVWNKFRDREVSTSDLKNFIPAAFERRHPCNCTFLFSVFQAAGFVTKIRGGGRPRDPFYVVILTQPMLIETVGD